MSCAMLVLRDGRGGSARSARLSVAMRPFASRRSCPTAGCNDHRVGYDLMGGPTMRDDAAPGTPPERPRAGMNRRDALRLAAVGAAAGLAAPQAPGSVRQARRPARRVVVAG